MDEELPPPIPAATLILMRPSPAGGPPEILFLERAKTMAFAAGALVFPGGRIDPEDHEAAALLAPGIADGAARFAAIRETIEETGIAPALPAGADVGALRAALAAGASFGPLLAQFGLTPDLAALTPFARWCPNFREARRFDTLFYLAHAPAGADPPRADAAEAVHSFWATAATVLAAVEAGRAHAIFPTRRNLERLARFASLDDARADAAEHPVTRITPWVEARGDRRFVCIPEGIGYPVTAEPYESARRR
ncbi:MAG: NUDIX hydrolase [Alphaproteobacteria bacterium]|nr:NUDIX hydrolase [Alphaproteobacteria bacterium]